jgi:hypothetical protein
VVASGCQCTTTDCGDHQPAIARPTNPQKEAVLKQVNPPPDQAMAEHPLDYSDPELRAYTDEQAEDILETIVHYMPIVLPVTAAILIFMLAFIAVFMA